MANEEHVEIYEKKKATIQSSKLLQMFCGDTRSTSVENGLSYSKHGLHQILIQDGARPFTSNKIIKHCINGAISSITCFPGIKIPDAILLKERK